MRLSTILSATLGLSTPWQLTAATISDDRKRLDITVEYEPATIHNCPHSGHPCMNIETETSQWFHNDFLSYETYLHAVISRPVCSRETTGTDPPWQRTGSRFTLV